MLTILQSDINIRPIDCHSILENIGKKILREFSVTVLFL